MYEINKLKKANNNNITCRGKSKISQVRLK